MEKLRLMIKEGNFLRNFKDLHNIVHSAQQWMILHERFKEKLFP